ncbi:hypothetical protein AMECASPLE_018052 [Ameca splendens]|uniref:Uncharacterized protein n=1 Tax=Ameca splendens TaxID=208324 RepID=A0ABV0ZMG3_9TELE
MFGGFRLDFVFQVPSWQLPVILRLLNQAQVNHLDFLRFTHLGPDSLYPGDLTSLTHWRFYRSRCSITL